MPTPASVQVVQDVETAALLLDGARLRLLGELAEPASAAGLARRLGLPRQQIGYHLRELEKGGLVELVEERRKGNCTERVVRATARSYVVGPAALGRLGGDPGTVRDRFSVSYLVAVAARAIKELAQLAAGAAAARKRLSTLTLDTEICFASAAARNAFAEELATAVADLAARYHDDRAPGHRRFRVVAAAYPVPIDPQRPVPAAALDDAPIPADDTDDREPLPVGSVRLE
jgi:DNA-binding transcriptional ArsR family regulator